MGPTGTRQSGFIIDSVATADAAAIWRRKRTGSPVFCMRFIIACLDLCRHCIFSANEWVIELKWFETWKIVFTDTVNGSFGKVVTLLSEITADLVIYFG